MLPLPHPVFLSSLAADRPLAERVRQEECVCARAAAESGVCVVPSGGEREEEGGGVEQTAHAHCEGAAERAAGNTYTHTHPWGVSAPRVRQSRRPAATEAL